MSLPCLQVDAFTDAPFGGNPAAVVLTSGDPDTAWAQAVADEMNLSETAFVWREPEVGGSRDRPGGDSGVVGPMAAPSSPRWGLRWFTPAAEVELCGHATLAAAHVLWTRGEAEAQTPIVFQTRFSGELICRTVFTDGATWILMDFPADPPAVTAPPPGLLDALGLDGSQAQGVYRSRFDLLIELATASEVQSLTPDFRRLAGFDVRGVIVTSPADRAPIPRGGRVEISASESSRSRATQAGSAAAEARPDPGEEEAGEASPDFVSRFFAPRLRIEEDPVTGSAHCVLAPFWASRLGDGPLLGRQLSRRGGSVRCQVRPQQHRVELGGQAVTVSEGRLLA